MKKCPSCGARTDSKFCPECGTDLSSVPEVKICPNCGAESTTKFCPECGANLSTLQTEEEADAVQVIVPEKQEPAESVITIDEPESGADSEQSKKVFVGNSLPKTKKSKKKLFIILGAVLLVLIIIGSIAGGGDEDTSSTEATETEATYEEETTTTEETTTEPTTEAVVDEFTKEEDYDSVSYDKLARNPDDYEGSLVKGSGNVLQVLDGDTEVDMRVGTSSDGYDDVVYLIYDPSIVDSRILEDDQVTYYGRSLGLYTYESTMGGEITIPLIQVHKITRD